MQLIRFILLTGTHEQAEVQAVNRLRYDEVVLPSRVVAIPGNLSLPSIYAKNQEQEM